MSSLSFNEIQEQPLSDDVEAGIRDGLAFIESRVVNEDTEEDSVLADSLYNRWARAWVRERKLARERARKPARKRAREREMARGLSRAARKQAARKETTTQHEDSKPIIGPSEREDNNIVDHEADGRRNCKVDLEQIFIISNFILELLLAVFDQISSVHKPQYALFSMLMSFSALLVCIIELVYKARKERVTWKWMCLFPWLYYPSQNHKPFGNFRDIIGLVCALCQSIVAAISYGFVHRHADNPIKVSVWPIIFAFGLLCSKFLEKPERRLAGSISQR